MDTVSIKRETTSLKASCSLFLYLLSTGLMQNPQHIYIIIQPIVHSSPLRPSHIDLIRGNDNPLGVNAWGMEPVLRSSLASVASVNPPAFDHLPAHRQ